MRRKRFILPEFPKGAILSSDITNLLAIGGFMSHEVSPLALTSGSKFFFDKESFTALLKVKGKTFLIAKKKIFEKGQ